MKPSTKKKAEFLAYALYVLILASGFLYYRFPSEALGQYLQKNLQRISPAYILTFESIDPCFPPGISLHQARLVSTSDPRTIPFAAENAIIRPRIGALLRGRPEYGFRLIAYGGRVEGKLKPRKGERGFTASLEFTDLRMDEYTCLLKLSGRSIKGRLTGNATYSRTYGSLGYGRGQANLALEEGSIGLSEPILGMNTLDFSKLLLGFSLEKDVIRLSHAELLGGVIRATLSGNINLATDLLQSRVDLRGTLVAAGNVRNNRGNLQGAIATIGKRSKRVRLRFVISGTLRKPRFRITG